MSRIFLLSLLTVLIHTHDGMNTVPHTVNSHAGVEAYSSLEPIWRYRRVLPPSLLMPAGIPAGQDKPWYPRVKTLPDSTYIMFYQGGTVASRVLCCYSDDLIHWNAPKILYSPYSVSIGGDRDYRRFTTIDACLLDDGTLLSIVSYRAGDHYNQGLGSGLMASRSTDGGHTWSRPVTIYEGPNWEPYVLQLPDGRIQVYFTDATPQTRNSGTSLIESFDDGYTFTPKKRVSRQYKYYDKGERIYTDQMPAVQLLNDGKTLMCAVEARLELDGPDTRRSYWLSVVYNDGFDWQDLGEDSAGPKRRSTNVLDSNAPYLVDLPSGEVILSTGYHGRHSLKIADHTGTKFNQRHWETDWLQPFEQRGVWGSIEATADKHHIISTQDTKERGILIGVSYLNHRIDAPAQETVVDGDGREWAGTEALFIGSDCPTETLFRASHDDTCLYLLAERRDTSVDAASTIALSVCQADRPKRKVSLTVGPEGAVGKLPAGVDVQVQRGETADGDGGYVAEIAIPLSLLGGGGEMAFYASVRTGKVNDTFFGAREGDSSTWQRIRLTD